MYSARAEYWTALLVLLAAIGCSEGTVVATGHVMIEGKPATGGRLSLTPVGGGPRAFSLVDEQGAFALRATGGTSGAFPGSYQVTFQQPLDAATEKSVARELAGELSADEVKMCYRGPRDEPFVIPDSGGEDLVIDIRLDQGWTRCLIE